MSSILGLNDKQMEACSYTEGPLLILAGAGSGKTRVITHRIAYLIDEKSVNPYNILAITFTNKAANEMRERVDKIVGEGAEYVWVSTFHSMCVRILRRFYDRIGGDTHFTIYDTDDQKAVIKEVLKTLNLDPKQYSEKMCIKEISSAKEEFLHPDDLTARAGTSYREANIANIYREYEKRMRQNNALDFDDLIFRTLELFGKCPDVLHAYQERFHYIMVDEYQDTNHSQFLLVRYLAGGQKNLCVVGDDDQSIYKFRGANIYNILNFEQEYPDAKVVKLEQNYRSTSTILNAANAVISNNKGRKQKKLWTENEEGNSIIFNEYQDEYHEAEGVVDQLIQNHRNGVPFADMAILYRTNNQSRVLEEKLVMNNVAYKMVGGTNFYQRKEIRDLVCYLKCISNPSDEVSFTRIINVPRRGIGATTINKIRDEAAMQGCSMYDICIEPEGRASLGRSAGKIEGFMEMMEKFRDMARENELSILYDEILEATGYVLQLEQEGTDEAKARISNIEELKNKIVTYEQNAPEPTLMGLLEEISLVADQDLSENTDAVTMMTLHSAKGLEFPYVHIVGMEERLFPSGLSIDSDDPDAVEEERRLCYVGITRAMKQLYMSMAETRMINGARNYLGKSRFMEEIPEELLEVHESGFSSDFGNFSSGKRNSLGTSSYGGSSYGSSYGSSRGSSYGRKPYGDTSADVFSGVDEPFPSTPKHQTKYSNLESIPGLSKGLPASGGVADYEVGDTVRHFKFGKGVVTEKTPSGSDFEVCVDFESCGPKKMFASLAKLRKV